MEVFQGPNSSESIQNQSKTIPKLPLVGDSSAPSSPPKTPYVPPYYRGIPNKIDPRCSPNRPRSTAFSVGTIGFFLWLGGATVQDLGISQAQILKISVIILVENGSR